MKRVTRSALVAVERRSVAMRDSTINGRHFSGHAAVFGQRTAIGNPLQWGFYEIVNRAAFNKSLADRADVVLLADHDPAKPLARVSADTLTLRTDDAGLFVDAPNLVNTSYADDLIANLMVRNVQGMSFGFQTLRDNWTTETIDTTDGQQVDVDVRELLEVRLIEVSSTAFPAYGGTDADVRSALQSRALRTGHEFHIAPRALHVLGTELRAGAVLSAASLGTLQQVLDLIATADDAVDAAQPVLAALMGVPNPDEDDENTPEANAAEVTETCPDCGCDLPMGSAFCFNCGAPIPARSRRASNDATEVCPDCGCDLPEGSTFCPLCGAPIQRSSQPVNTTGKNGNGPGAPHLSVMQARLRATGLAALYGLDIEPMTTK